MRILSLFILLIVAGIVAVGWWAGSSESDSAPPPPLEIKVRPNAYNVYFEPAEPRHYSAPKVESLDIPKSGYGDVSWGSVGRDNNGNIYVGLSESFGDPRSAHLLKIASNGAVTELGSVVNALPAELTTGQSVSQGKIHSQIVEASDGHLYFSSFDEAGETDVRLPDWGGHLWRYNTISNEWQHLLAVPEALIAVNTDGRYIYALGYWGHVLYQYDIQTGQHKRVEVGSVPGHVSRQFLVDGKGHVYVPKVFQNPGDAQALAVLVEFDSNLNILNEFELSEYKSDNMPRYRGIIAYTTMKNGDVYFTLGEGELLQIQANESGSEKLLELGYFNPAGKANIPSLFTVDGEQFVMGASRRKGSEPEWLIFEKLSGATVAYELPELKNFLFFGTQARDNDGAMYLVGRDESRGSERGPKVVKLSFPKQ